MWDRIHKNFVRETGGTTRSSGSLMNRYNAINKEVTFFNAQVAHMVNENRSVYTEIDNLRETRVLYVKTKDDTFRFEHCWEVLKTSPKWMEAFYATVSHPTQTEQ
ncbi:hypothetical protein G6F56_004489 [Rhizopus delemar]|nr:hypothetical protein G6F56_004489 [Rhizopus delemar]